MVLIDNERLNAELQRLRSELERALGERDRLLAELDRLTGLYLRVQQQLESAQAEIDLLTRSLGVRMSRFMNRWPAIKDFVIRTGNKFFPEK